MSTTPMVQPHHLRRKAVISMRPSTGHQVLTHLESQQLQHARREHAHHLGWPAARIEVVETDTGRTAQSTERRDGSKALLAEVALGQVGMGLSYASTRLSRNCTAGYPLLELCAYHHCLIADRDGVYDAATPKGRLLLGMKGIVSESELPTLRGRLMAGVPQKAPRGAFALALPGRFAAPRRRRRGQRSRPGRAAGDWLGLPDLSRAALCQSSGAPVSRPGSPPAPSPSPLRHGVAQSHPGGGDCDLAQ